MLLALIVFSSLLCLNSLNITIIGAFAYTKLLHKFSRTHLSVSNPLVMNLEIFYINSRRSAVIFPISSCFLCLDTLTLTLLLDPLQLQLVLFEVSCNL